MRCFSQQPGLFATVIARTAGEPLALAQSVQQAIWSVEADQPMWKIRSGDTLVNGSVQTERFVMLLMSSAAALALLLAARGTARGAPSLAQRPSGVGLASSAKAKTRPRRSSMEDRSSADCQSILLQDQPVCALIVADQAC